MIEDLMYTDREVAKRLEKKTPLELLYILREADKDIKSGRDFASVYQKFSICSTVLRTKGITILRTSDIQMFIEKLGGE